MIAPSDPPKKPRWRILKGIGVTILILAALITWDVWTAMGTAPEGERLERIAESPQYSDGRFANVLPVQNEAFSLDVMREFFFGGSPHRTPETTIPTVTRTAADFAEAPDSLRVTWLGHSTLLIELDGTRLLIDPVWGERVSPSSVVGSKRFFDPPLSLNALPPIDAVLISHDHYDHLDLPTIQALADRVPRFLVPLGIGSHLEYWGVAAERIVELDWWDETEVGGVRLVSTPARHFSGRSLTDGDATLWTGWAMLGTEQRVFYSGDTSLTPSFAKVGKRFGPFDVTIIETGAYNPAWRDVHLGPEQAVAVHRMVRGDVMLPVHWCTFNLAMHGWIEPAERVRIAAEPLGIAVAFPRPGESITATDYPTEAWWPTLPFDSAEEVSTISTSLPDSVRALIP